MSILSDPAILWYVNRAAGLVLLVLLTVATVLGVSAIDRRTRPRVGPAGVRRTRPIGRFPGFVVPELHRRISLIAVVLIALHIVPAVLDDYVPIGWLDVVVPFAADYKALWLGLGTVTFDVLGVVVVTALFRLRLGRASWKVVHKAVYVAWPLAVAHSVGMGTDKGGFAALVTLSCVAVVVVTLSRRLRSMWIADRSTLNTLVR